MSFMGYYQVLQLPLDTLIHCESFECAVSKLSNTAISGPGYFGVTGLSGNEGVILARDRLSTAHETWLSEDSWYLF